MPKSSAWPSIDTGQLRHKGVIEEPSLATPDPLGQPDSQWAMVRSCWASIDLITGREASLPDLLVSQVTHVITVRWTPVPLNASMRARFGSHVYQIQAIENVAQRNVVLRLLALEINPTS